MSGKSFNFDGGPKMSFTSKGGKYMEKLQRYPRNRLLFKKFYPGYVNFFLAIQVTYKNHAIYTKM